MTLLSDQDAYQAGQTEPADATACSAVNKSTSISGILFIANDALPHYCSTVVMAYVSNNSVFP